MPLQPADSKKNFVQLFTSQLLQSLFSASSCNVKDEECKSLLSLQISLENIRKWACKDLLPCSSTLQVNASTLWKSPLPLGSFFFLFHPMTVSIIVSITISKANAHIPGCLNLISTRFLTREFNSSSVSSSALVSDRSDFLAITSTMKLLLSSGVTVKNQAGNPK